MAKPTQKALPKAKPFDPGRTRPVPDVLLPEPRERLAIDEELGVAPSQRSNPVKSYCKGGKVLSSRRM